MKAAWSLQDREAPHANPVASHHAHFFRMSLRPVLVVGPLYTVSERGLTSDLLVSRSLGMAPLPICTQLVVASGGIVTDVTDVPVDTVIAQLEHTLNQGKPEGIKIGGLASAATAEAVLDGIRQTKVPVVLDIVASGPSGETLLNADGIDAVAARLDVAELVTVSRADAELVTGGSIESLDDAQVAAQRIHHRGASRVVIRCGNLPYRFYDAADDPGGDGAAASPLSFDLYFDGDDFALFEAPQLDDAGVDGLSSVFTLAALSAWMEGAEPEICLQRAKRHATDALRLAHSVDRFPQRAWLPSS